MPVGCSVVRRLLLPQENDKISSEANAASVSSNAAQSVRSNSAKNASSDDDRRCRNDDNIAADTIQSQHPTGCMVAATAPSMDDREINGIGQQNQGHVPLENSQSVETGGHGVDERAQLQARRSDQGKFKKTMK
nr:hypothetical protein Iba_chr01aCG7560 [Ipomoea batatas]